jgi:exonuclease SbcC
MQITRIKLKNVGLHREVDWETDGGVVGITGENGEGKSTLLLIQEYGILGRLAETELTKEDLITHGESEGSVTLWFSSGGKTGSIHRDLHASTRLLEWDGAKYKKAEDVDRVMSQILGTSLDSFRATSFIRQGELKNALFGTNAHRRDIMIRLLDAGHVAPMHSSLERWVKKYRTQNLDETVYGRRDTLRAELDNHRATVTSLQTRVADLGFDDAVFTRFERYRSLTGSLQEAKEELNSVYRGLSALPAGIREGYESLKEGLDASYTALQALDKNLAEVRESLKNAEKVGLLKDSICELETKAQPLSLLIDNQRARLAELLKTLGIDSVEEHSTFVEGLKARTNMHTILEQVKELDMELLACQEELERIPAESKDPAPHLDLASRNEARIQTLQSGLDVLKRANGGECTGDRVNCPKCNLKVLPREMISPEGIQTIEQDIADLKREADNARDLAREAAASIRETEVRRKAAHTRLTQAETRRDSIAAVLAALRTKGIQPLTPGEEHDRLVKAGEDLLEVNRDLQRLTTEHDLLVRTRLREEDTLKDVMASLDGFDTEAAHDRLRALEQEREQEGNRRVEKQTKLSALLPDYERWQRLSHDLDRLEGVKIPQLKSQIEDCKPEGAIADLLTASGGQDLDTIYQGLLAKRKEYENLQGELRLANREEARVLKELDEVQVLVERQQTLRHVLQRMEDLTRVTCSEGAVKSYILHAFRALYPYVTAQLSVLDANFTIRPSADALSFDALRIDKKDSHWMNMSMLSGGQKVKLALAFLLALQSTLCKTSNFLVLDEPSVHLDAGAVDSLAGMITKLSTLLSNSDGQCWIVDHHEVLQGAFTKNFRLNANRDITQ